MLQPCHVNVMIYAALLCPLTDRFSKMPHLVFNILIYQSWGVIMAIIAPDLRDSNQFLEKFFFWYEHYILLIIPAYSIYTRRFHIIPGNFDLTMASFFILAVYHSLVLTAISLITATNLNYLLKPPVGILENFGPYYRAVMYCACLPITFFTRFVIWYPVELVLEKARIRFEKNSTMQVPSGPVLRNRNYVSSSSPKTRFKIA